ncbi:MAG: methylmalonyl Co-A mutase-associated GTPase MeaB [Pseudomonadota bacterium]
MWGERAEMGEIDEIAALSEAVAAGNRRALARAITLIESTRDDHRVQARALLGSLPQPSRPALRIGLSGTPGVGKSTFIEAFGMMLIDLGLRVAVLAVDPSSARSGGSILGDKTRMERLSRAPEAFIRPSPSQSTLGGVARRTRDAIAVCEGARYDVILVETVGVGQSETMVADMTDLFVLLLAPAGGDELQGVKRGIMEIADIILVNKADGALRPQAVRTCADYAGALRLMRRRAEDPPEFPRADPVSALTGEGLAQAWQHLQTLAEWRQAEGHFDARRAGQARHWLTREIEDGLQDRFHSHPGMALRLEALRREVDAGRLSPDDAAEEALDFFLSGGPNRP